MYTTTNGAFRLTASTMKWLTRPPADLAYLPKPHLANINLQKPEGRKPFA